MKIHFYLLVQKQIINNNLHYLIFLNICFMLWFIGRGELKAPVTISIEPQGMPRVG